MNNVYGSIIQHPITKIVVSKFTSKSYSRSLHSRNMKIDVKDRSDLTRLLYSAHSMKPYIKNVHVIRLMEGDNNEVENK